MNEIIKTQRLSIRLAVSNDAKIIADLWNNPVVMRNVGFPKGLCVSQEDVIRNLAEFSGTFLDRLLMVENLESGDVIGQAMMRSPDAIGRSQTDIKIFPEHQNQGFGNEIKQSLTAYLLGNTNCIFVEATPNIDNVASVRMQESAGAIRVGRGRWLPPVKNTSEAQPVDYWIYRIYRDSTAEQDIRTRNHRYSAIIPAAGRSSRMQRFKPLLPWPPGKSPSSLCVIQSTILSLMNAGVEPLFVVTGYNADIICDALHGWPVTFQNNPDFTAPMSHSVALTIPRIDPDSAILILPGDHPSVDPETIRRLIRCHEVDPGKIHIPVFNGRGGHPSLFPSSAHSELARFDLKQGLRSIICESVFEVVRYEVQDSGVLINLDFPTDYVQQNK